MDPEHRSRVPATAFWIEGERSLYDQPGSVYTLLNFSGKVVNGSLQSAFASLPENPEAFVARLSGRTAGG